MKAEKRKNAIRARRKQRNYWKVRKNSTRPRLHVFRSARHFYGSVIDDEKRVTLVACSTRGKAFPKGEFKSLGGVKAAEKVGQLLAQAALAQGVREVVFDRSIYRYHGRVKAFADAARKGGLKF